MIGRHDFNSEWLGVSVGVVTDDALFAATESELRDQLAPWAWVEARGPLDPAHRAAVARAGFDQVDTQMPFRIGLSKFDPTASVAALHVRFADEVAFRVNADDVADFTHERFASLDGITLDDLNRRYALWSAALVDSGPDQCMEVLSGGRVQGWFLSRDTDAGLELTLAMLRRDAQISGHLLYQRALVAYRDRGARVGHAAFSVTNTAVHNIYAALGARFLTPSGCWLWQASHPPPPPSAVS